MTSLLVIDIIFHFAFSILYHSLEDELTVTPRKDHNSFLAVQSTTHPGWQSFSIWPTTMVFMSPGFIFQQLFVAAEDIWIQNRLIHRSNIITVFFIVIYLESKSGSDLDHYIC
jgi:hypothetical protein